MDVDLAALSNLLEKEAIRDAALRYTRGIDRHDSALLLSAYHPDAIDDHGDYIGSPQGFVDYANSVHAQNWVGHHHYITNQFIERDGDTAHSEIYFMAVLKRPDGVCDMVGGRYLDRLEKRDGVWAVADRMCLVEWNVVTSPGPDEFDPSLFMQGRWDRKDPSYTRPLRVTRPHRNPLGNNEDAG